MTFATGDYPINENSAAKISSRTFTSMQFPDSFKQFKLLEAELLYHMNYTSVAVKGSEASDVSSQVLALYSGVRLHCAA